MHDFINKSMLVGITFKFWRRKDIIASTIYYILYFSLNIEHLSFSNESGGVLGRLENRRSVTVAALFTVTGGRTKRSRGGRFAPGSAVTFTVLLSSSQVQLLRVSWQRQR